MPVECGSAHLQPADLLVPLRTDIGLGELACDCAKLSIEASCFALRIAVFRDRAVRFAHCNSLCDKSSVALGARVLLFPQALLPVRLWRA